MISPINSHPIGETTMINRSNEEVNESAGERAAEANKASAKIPTKADSSGPKSTKTQPKIDTLELSKEARAKQPSTKKQLSVAAHVRLLKQQGKTVSQIATSLGLNVKMVDSYLGIAATSAPKPATVTEAEVPVKK